MTKRLVVYYATYGGLGSLYSLTEKEESRKQSALLPDLFVILLFLSHWCCHYPESFICLSFIRVIFKPRQPELITEPVRKLFEKSHSICSSLVFQHFHQNVIICFVHIDETLILAHLQECNKLLQPDRSQHSQLHLMS